MIMHDYAWLHEYAWLCMVCMNMHSMSMHEHALLRMKMQAYVWICMNMHEYAWICMNVQWMFKYMHIYINIYKNIYTTVYNCVICIVPDNYKEHNYQLDGITSGWDLDRPLHLFTINQYQSIKPNFRLNGGGLV